VYGQVFSGPLLARSIHRVLRQIDFLPGLAPDAPDPGPLQRFAISSDSAACESLCAIRAAGGDGSLVPGDEKHRGRNGDQDRGLTSFPGLEDCADLLMAA